MLNISLSCSLFATRLTGSSDTKPDEMHQTVQLNINYLF
jgi:hypothetical protein